MIYVIGTLVAIALIVMFVISTYNGLVQLRNMVKNQWAQIDVHLKRRADLIPNLVETVKGYAAHEKDTLDAVITARNKAVSATDSSSSIEAQGELTQALGRLFALTEAYPDLKANQNFMSLQSDLKDTENKIAYARQFYNDAVKRFNDKIQMFPSNIIAGMFNFKIEAFFEASEAEKATPKVQF